MAKLFSGLRFWDKVDHTLEAKSNIKNKNLAGLANALGYSDKDLELPELAQHLSDMLATANHGDKKGEFSDYWDTRGFIDTLSIKASQTQVESTRQFRYNQYEFMLANSSEVGQAMMIYSEEATSVILEDSSFFSVEVVDDHGDPVPAESKLLAEEFDRIGVFRNPRSLIKQLATYGDAFRRIDGAEISTDAGVRSLKVSSYLVDSPHLIDRENLPMKDVAFKYMQRPTPQSTQKIEVPPWDMVHYRMDSSRRDLSPYGEGLLEPARSVYKRLMIIESLLALSRQSRIEHTVVKVPTNTDNPDIMITKLVKMKNMIKNIIFGDAASASSGNHTTAFSQMLFVPQGRDGQSFEVDKLNSTVDLGDISDVEFFHKKVTNALGIPQSYLDSDDAYSGYRKLALQDLRLSRKINSIIRAMAEGHSMFGKLLVRRLPELFPKGRNVNILFSPPSPIAEEQLSSISSSVSTIRDILEVTSKKNEDTGEPEYNPMKIKALLLVLAKLPKNLVDVIMLDSKDGERGEALESFEQAIAESSTIESVSSVDMHFIPMNSITYDKLKSSSAVRLSNSIQADLYSESCT